VSTSALRHAADHTASAESDPDTVSRAIRVASVPSSHVYIRHLTPAVPLGHPVVRLTDPDPDDPRRSAVSRWWPPAMLDAEWVHEHAAEFDVFHLQFGFDARTPHELRALLTALQDDGKPFVYTVHDLRNPHHLERAEHDAQLDVLVPGADALITLTPGAAAEIERRWGRRAEVLPHPHVVDVETMQRVQDVRGERAVVSPSAPFVVGVHVKSLRASMNPLPVIEVLTRTVRELSDTVLRVDGHSDVLLADGARYDPALATFLREAEARGDLQLHVHDFFSDAELWSYLASLDASVLPYRFGTHSGWLEACRDLGTTVIAPDCGFYAEQGPVISYHHDETVLDPVSLADAVRRARTVPPVPALAVEYRLAQRDAVAAAHARIYEALVQ
jgi:glycosyltransferase involved in cell wall biosynthesis